MTDKRYLLNGKVVRESTSQCLTNLQVEAWDKDLIFDDPLDAAETDEQGRFQIEFTAVQFRGIFRERNPDLFFKIFQNGELIHSTEHSVLWNVNQSEIGTEENPLIIAIDLPEAPDSEPEPPLYSVQGHIRNTAGQPLPNSTVQVYDIALSGETLLGETTTDPDGFYRIEYHPATDKAYLDREVRVLDATNTRLDQSSINRNQRHVRLNFGNAPLPASEYEQLLTALTPFLEGRPLTQLTPAEIMLLADKTDLNPQHLSLLMLSTQLASQTQLPAEFFYGLLRQSLPSQLLPLLNLPAQTWRTAINTALDRNLVPATLRATLETNLAQLQQMAEAATQADDDAPGTPPSQPRIRLNPRRLRRSLLQNLTAADSSHAYLNTTLNATLKQVLSDSLTHQGYTTLATFVKTMPDVDLGTVAETSIQDFIAAQVDRALEQNSFATIRPTLTQAVQTLSSTTTLSQLLGLDTPLETHPLFEHTAQLTRLHSLLNTSSLRGDRPLQTRFIDHYQAQGGSIQAFWQTLQDDDAFGAETVADLQFTFQLGTLTQNNALLVQSLRDRVSSPNANTPPTLRQLTQLKLQDWKESIQQTSDDETPELPDNIAGDTPESRADNYARLLMTAIEQAFPTDFVAKTVIDAPQIHPTSLHQILEQHPDLNLQDTLPDDGELPDELAVLQREIRQYPDFDYRAALSRFNGNGSAVNLRALNPIRQNLQQFFHNAQDFDFRLHRVDDYLMEQGETAFQNIPQDEQPQVRVQLKRMQRVFEIAPRAEYMQTLMSQGFHSAYSVCQVPYKVFMQTTGNTLGDVTRATRIYRNAQAKVAKALVTALQIHQNANDWLPFVLGGAPHTPALSGSESTWANLFGSISLCECKHCRSVYSPSAYLVELLEFINPKVAPETGKRPFDVLKQRRPDLMHIQLTCENAETPLPYIDLVNEILECYVVHQHLRNESHNTEKVTAAELKANPQFIQTRAYDRLKEGIYPFSLPFDRDIETVRVYLKHLGCSRYELMRSLLQPNIAQQTHSTSIPPHALEHPILLTEPSLLADNQTRTIQEQTAFAAEYLGISPSECDVIVGYRPRYIYEAYGYESVFQFNNSSLFEPDGERRIIASELIQCLGIRYIDLIELIKTRFVNRDRSIKLLTEESGCDLEKIYLVPQNPNTEAAFIRGIVFNLSHRFIRLWQRLNLSILDLDCCIAALQPETLNEALICQLSVVMQLTDSLRVPVVKLLSLWADIDIYGEDSLYHQLFMNKAALDMDAAFYQAQGDIYLPRLDEEELISNHIPTLLAGFRISVADFELIQLDAEIDSNSKLTLDRISKLYRYTVLAKALKLSIKDFITLKTISGINPFESPDRTAEFHKLAQKVEAANFSIAELNYLYRHQTELPNPFQLDRETLLRLIATLRKGLDQIAAETQSVDAPAGESAREKLTTLLGEDIAQKTTQTILDTAATRTAPVTVPPETITELASIELDGEPIGESQVARIITNYTLSLPGSVIESVGYKVNYDEASKVLSFSGLIMETNRQRLLSIVDLSGSPEFLTPPTDLPEGIDLSGIEAAICEAYELAVEQLFQASEQFVRDAEIFIENSFGDLLNVEDAIAHLIEAPSVDEAGKPDTEKLTAKFNYLLVYLRDRLSRDFIKQTLSETLQLAPEMVGLLIEEILFAAQASSNEELVFAIANILSLRTLVSDAEELSPLRWQGYLEIPADADYRFYLELGEINEDTHFKMWLGNELEPIINSSIDNKSELISLQAGHLYSLTIEATTAADSQLPTIYWSHATLTKEPVPSEMLYSYHQVLGFEQTLIRLQKAALLIDSFALNVQEISYLANHAWSLGVTEHPFLGINLNDFPLLEASTPETLSKSQVLFQQWQRLADYIALRDRLPKAQATLIDFIRLVETGVSCDHLTVSMMEQIVARVSQDQDAIAYLAKWSKTSEDEPSGNDISEENSTPTTIESIRQAITEFSKNPGIFRDLLTIFNDKPNQLITIVLASITNWPLSSLEHLLGDSGFNLNIEDLQNEIWLSRLQTCLQLVKRLGAAPEKLFSWAKTGLTSSESQDIKDTVKAKYDDETWLTVAQSLNNQLREQQRDTLVDYILALTIFRSNLSIQDSNDLFEYFLIDVNMSACMLTSRLKQAISSVQLFIHRCLMNLEPQVSPESIEDDQWKWMNRYRVWEANRKVFLYPENWIEPELRDDKSPFFKELESELLQNDLTEPYIETVFLSYLKKLDEVARLEICAMYWEGTDDGRKAGGEILHVFGRAFNSPNIYYRKLINETGVWTAWELVNVGIDLQPDGVHLIPVVFNRRLYLFWPIFTQKPDEENPAPEGAPPRMKWEIQLAWSEYWDGKWQPKKMSPCQVYSNAYNNIKEPIELETQSSRQIDFISLPTDYGDGLIFKDLEWTTTFISSNKVIHLNYLPLAKNHFFSVTKKYSFSTMHLEVEVLRSFKVDISPAYVIQSHIRKTKYSARQYSQESYSDEQLAGFEESAPGNWTKIVYEEPPPGQESIEIFLERSKTELIEENPKVIGIFHFEASGNTTSDQVNYFSLEENEVIQDMKEGEKHFNFFIDNTSRKFKLFKLNLFPDQRIFRNFDFPNNSYKSILIPHQRPLLEIFNKSNSIYPFFCENSQAIYFAKPMAVALCQEEIESDSTPIDPFEPEHDPFWELEDPAGPYINLSDWVVRNFLGEYINSNNAESSVDSINKLVFEARLASKNVDFQGIERRLVDNSQLVINTPSALALRSISSYCLSVPSVYIRAGIQPYYLSYLILKFRFETHYHPYVTDFISRLNKDGISGLLDLETQNQSKTGIFEQYQPNKEVVCLEEDCIPIENVDFEFDGAYSLYNWELFFHIPLTIAIRLSQDQRFEEAQQWFHYIFNPTDSSPPDDSKPWARYWKVRPFQETERETLTELLERLHAGDIDQQIAEWRNDPFKPHLIARKRLLAYQKTAVMKYIDNLIAWGDQLFRQDTIESINEATQLYILAHNILGRRPDFIPAHQDIDPETYHSLKSDYGIDPFGNALVPFEDADAANPKTSTGIQQAELYKNDDLFVTSGNSGLQLSSSAGSKLKRISRPGDRPTVGGISLDSRPSYFPGLTLFLQKPDETFYFCIPQNDHLLSYWDTVSDRLFKIRHCMNIEGVVRELPLYEPPIDPALLVRAAAKGIDLGSVLNDMYAPLSPYRFSYMLQKALELCAEVKSLGATLLSTLEKKDVEALSILRARQETDLLKLIRDLKQQQIDEARENKLALEKSWALAQVRYGFYKERVNETEENKRTSYEEEQLDKLEDAREKEKEAEADEKKMADWAKWCIDLSTSASGPKPGWSAGVTWGRNNAIAAYEASAREHRAKAAQYHYESNLASIQGSLYRRAQEWQLQKDLAQAELLQIERQIAAADIRIAIAEYELNHHDKQIENAVEVETFLRDKYTNQELYNWMTGQISTIYFQSYKLAYDLAKRAEQTYRFDQGITSSNFIQFGYWDSLRKGLLSGEQLHLDLKRLEIAYLEANKRDYELTKHISLLQLDPVALLGLRTTGKCSLQLPEELFDMDCPGHYFRRIKSVALTIPCVTGPYTSVNCTLTLHKSAIRKNALRSNAYARTDLEDDRFSDYFGSLQSIVTSSAQNDSGLFETNLRDERYLPFEGSGVISEWQLQLPNDPSAGELCQFDYSTISDVILHLRYTAREGGGLLRNGAVGNITTKIQEANALGLARLFSLKHEFPAEWHQFVTSKTNEDFTATIKKSYFPFFAQGKTINIDKVELHAIQDEGLESTTLELDVTALSTNLNSDNEAFELSLSENDVLQRQKQAQVFVIFHYSV